MSQNSKTRFEPADIELDVRKDLKITWYDNHSSVYPLEILRKECPCAACQVERREDETQENSPPVNPFNVLSGTIVKQVEALNVEPVGNYALRFEWNDNHNSGIYTYEYLRSICPCDDCKAERES